MKRKFRLTRSKDFKRVKETGQSVHHPLVVLVYARSGQTQPRIAVVVSKAIGNAVARNLVRRRLKSCISESAHRIKEYSDLVFFARREIIHASFLEIGNAIDDLLFRADLLEN